MDAKKPDPDAAQEAMGLICARYRAAMLGCFRLWTRDPQFAEEITSQFIEHLLKKNRLGHLERREESLFRGYLTTERPRGPGARGDQWDCDP